MAVIGFRTTVRGERLEIKEQLACESRRIVEQAAAGFAFPSRSQYLETLPDAPAVFPASRMPADDGSQTRVLADG